MLRHLRRRAVIDLLTLALVFGGYIVVMRYVLPRAGVQT